MKFNYKLKQSISIILVFIAFIYIANISSEPKNLVIKTETAPIQAFNTENAAKNPVIQASDSSVQQESQALSGTQKIENSENPSQPIENTSKSTVQKADNPLVQSPKADTGAATKENSVSSQPILEQKTAKVSRGMDIQSDSSFLLPWFGTVDKLFRIGSTATITDTETGISFKVTRTYGYNHADVETSTPKDTDILKKLAGGSWSWDRRSIVVEIKGRKIAASMNMMPHAGIDELPANEELEQRSGGYGPGLNLDSVKENEMDGHFCIHFYLSKTHSSDNVDELHQEMVMQANKWLLNKTAGIR